MSLDFNSFLPHELISIGGTILFLWVAGGVVFNLIRWRDVLGSYTIVRSRSPTIRSALRALGRTVARDILFQRDIFECNFTRWFSHISVFWGFILLAVSTTLDAMLNPGALPLAPSHPVRIIGNMGGILFVAGLMIMVYRRAFSGVRRSSTFADIFFLSMLSAVGLTGFLTEIFSDRGSFPVTFVVYWLHISLVTALFALAPFTKFVHAIGRPILSFLEHYVQPKNRK